ncbi:MAG: hypothetical protein OHK0026_06960 [Rhodocyclaceae bacterium]
MNKILLGAVASLFAANFALAQAPATAPAAAGAKRAPTAQQQKMADCNAQAKEKALKGDERKAFMKQCLSAKKATQQDRMKECNKQAGEKALKGVERKKFMSSCLKG